MISIKSSGSFKNTAAFLDRIKKRQMFNDLARFGQIGVDALSSATPRDTGETAQSWKYRIVNTKRGIQIEWYNTHVNKGSNIAILIQYGHGTGTGGYVQGTDYINPAIRPIFDKIAEDVWKKVTL